jgi:hypothetical protein
MRKSALTAGLRIEAYRVAAVLPLEEVPEKWQQWITKLYLAFAWRLRS